MGRDERQVARRRALEFWGGATWIHHSTIVNSGFQATLAWDVVPGEDTDMLVYQGSIFNGDALNRNCRVHVLDRLGGNILWMDHEADFGLEVGAGQFAPFPGSGASNDWSRGGSPILLSGLMSLHLTVDDIDANEDGSLGLTARIRGEKPTVTPTIPAAGTYTVDLDEVIGA